MKKCSSCKTEKDLSCFSKRVSAKDGLQGRCRDCESLAKKKYYEDNRERLKTSVKKRYVEKRHEILEQKAFYYKNTHRPRKLLQVYNLSEEKYLKMLDEQKNECAICNTNVDELPASLCVDHNHKTNEIRGLLCRDCNSAIGLLKDKPQVVKNAYQYLIERGHYG